MLQGFRRHELFLNSKVPLPQLFPLTFSHISIRFQFRPLDKSFEKRFTMAWKRRERPCKQNQEHWNNNTKMAHGFQFAWAALLCALESLLLLLVRRRVIVVVVGHLLAFHVVWGVLLLLPKKTCSQASRLVIPFAIILLSTRSSQRGSGSRMMMRRSLLCDQCKD